MNKYFEFDLYCNNFWILLIYFQTNQPVNKYNEPMNEGHTLKTKIINLNRLAELICKTIGENQSTKIEVVDCENFLVVKGLTSSNEILDLNDIKLKFMEKYHSESEEMVIGNTIDLINYGSEVLDFPNCSFDFFNSDNLRLNNCMEDSTIQPLILKSQFPFGYSYLQGKSLYYYAKHIAFNLQTKYIWDKLTVCISEKNIEDDLKIFVDTCQVENSNLKSAILDSFDFNFKSFQKKLDESDWWVCIGEDIDPAVVKSVNEDLIIF